MRNNPLSAERLVSDPNAQMLVEADQMIYDYDNEIVTAKGDVQIYYDGKTVEAQEVIYDQRARTLTASGISTARTRSEPMASVR